MRIRPASTRGHSDLGWLDSYHSFSFADWYDPEYMGVPPLRVLNDDKVAAGGGFGAHPHRDMEIVSYVVSGALAHQDSRGHKGVISAGEVQFMRAGTGVVHSEMNGSRTEPVHFLQVWFQPRARGLAPAYEQRKVAFPEHGGFAPLAGEGGIEIAADARMLALKLPAGGRAEYDVPLGRQAYAYVIEGELSVGPATAIVGDAGVISEGPVEFTTRRGVHAILFDLPA